MYLLTVRLLSNGSEDRGTTASNALAVKSAIASSDRPRSCARVAVGGLPFRASLLSKGEVSGSEFGVERLMDRCVERLADHPSDARGRSSDRSARSRSVHRSTGRPVGSPSVAVAAQSLVDYVRLAALCGLLRCEIAEDPEGNRRRRSMRRMPLELASGSSEKWRRPVSTGVRIPGSEPAANTDDRRASPPCQAYCVRDRVPDRKLVESYRDPRGSPGGDHFRLSDRVAAISEAR